MYLNAPNSGKVLKSINNLDEVHNMLLVSLNPIIESPCILQVIL